jgi:hypothetical protein
MSAFDRNVTVPRPLRKLHGHRATVLDLSLPYVAGLVATLGVLHQARNLPLGFLPLVLLGALAMDLAGGVVANFTEGTSDLYAVSRARWRLFISLHTLQPLVLLLVFPGDWESIATVAVGTIAAALAVDRVKTPNKQRVLASFLAVAGITVVFSSPFVHTLALQLSVLYGVKLVLAFAVRWGQGRGAFPQEGPKTKN